MEALKKLVKVSEQIIINMYDNGWMIEANGYDKEDDWLTCKIVVKDIQEVHTIIDLVTKLPRSR